jgi:hypothetical protein
MKTFTELASAPSHLPPFTDQPRLAVAARLARFKGSSREHTEEHDTGAWAVKTAEADWLVADLGLVCIGRFVVAALGICAAFYRGSVRCGSRG